MVDNAITDQPMNTPKLLPRFGPEIEKIWGQTVRSITKLGKIFNDVEE